MTDRVYPSTKPTTNGSTAPGVVAGNNAAAPASAVKPQLRHPYRPQPQYHSHRRRRSRRNLCCCCCFWSLLLLLALGLLASIAGAALYVLYRPQRPQFWVSSLRIAKLNLTTAADSSSSHLTSLLNLTLSSKNPNSHITFFYDPFALSCLTTPGSVQLANGSIPAFTSDKKNETSFRAIILTTSADLDTESVTSLRSDLKRKSGVPMKIQMDTKVKVKLGGLRSKKVGIRVSCPGITGVAPKSKSPSVASVSGSKCKVDLRIKIWKFTF
ncbi:NDR1/HIN1-like protein 13 [Corylus avellana]|uniref:NDR1/HIN1-like protein 13 n=1 Tax=Corylus avellana TaxID=13451 RepID=UPI001E1FDFF8|nr:NDR1/HIN1-like protein 13 [Corylus avellana]